MALDVVISYGHGVNTLFFFRKVWRKTFSFEGRASRKEFWSFFLLNFLVVFVVAIVGAVIDYPLAPFLYYLVSLVPYLSLSVRRAHDSDRSGFWVLVPVYSLFLAVREGNEGANRFGPDPWPLEHPLVRG
jgi:uncharacterized membrane protein YhaH (DUF805 family)